MSKVKGDTLFQSSKINVGDKVYITQKGQDECVIPGYTYLEHFTVCSKHFGKGRFAESFCTYQIINNSTTWTVCDEDFEDGMLATYQMLSPTDKEELWRREGIDMSDDENTAIPFDEECECHIKSWSQAEMNKQKMIEEEMEQREEAAKQQQDEYTGGSVNYYKIYIKNPTTEGVHPYTCECNDVIEALGMNYAEGNAFKALWRRAAARKGVKKKGYDGGLYDAEKVKFFGERLIVQSLEGE